MFLEANIPIVGSASLTDQRDWAGTAVALGYHGVAFNVFKGPNEKVEPRERCGVKAVPMDTLQATRERVRLALKGAQPLLDDSPSFTQLVRITAAVEEGGPEVIAERLPTVVGVGYDLAAVQPLNSDSFLSACFNSKADIVSFDVSHFVPSRPSPAAIKAVMQAGRVFEFCYGPALKDRSLLTPLLQGIKEVSEVTRGKSLILSCGATSARQLKRPADVAAMLTLAGLTRHQIRIILTVTPKKLLARAEARRQQNQQQRSCVTVHLSSPTPQAATPSTPDTALLSSLFSSLSFLRPPSSSNLSASSPLATTPATTIPGTGTVMPGDTVTTSVTRPDTAASLSAAVAASAASATAASAAVAHGHKAEEGGEGWTAVVRKAKGGGRAGVSEKSKKPLTSVSTDTRKDSGGGGGIASGKGGGSSVGVTIGGNALSKSVQGRSSSGGGVGVAGWGAVWEGDGIGLKEQQQQQQEKEQKLKGKGKGKQKQIRVGKPEGANEKPMKEQQAITLQAKKSGGKRKRA